MYKFLSFLSGVIISLMIASNGGLTGLYGMYLATIIIHLTGLIVIVIVLLVKRENPFHKAHVWYLYSGGAVGVFTILFNNYAFGKISISAILAIGLLGQAIVSLLMDQFGWFGMEKHPFKPIKLIGYSIVLVGIVAMTNEFHFIAILVSFCTGITIVLSRTTNAKLGKLTTVRISTFYNYVVGSIGIIIAFFLFGQNSFVLSDFRLEGNPLFYLGGVLGLTVVTLFNIVVVKVSQFYVTLLSFLGQIIMGIILDAVFLDMLSSILLIGALCVTLGFVVNMWFDLRDEKAKAEV